MPPKGRGRKRARYEEEDSEADELNDAVEQLPSTIPENEPKDSEEEEDQDDDLSASESASSTASPKKRRKTPTKRSAKNTPKKSSKASSKSKKLNFSHIKYANNRVAWFSEPSYLEAKHFYEQKSNQSFDIQTLLSQYESRLLNLKVTKLEVWLQERDISITTFQSIELTRTNTDTGSKDTCSISPLHPFSGKFPTSKSIQLDSFEVYCNLSSPIWHTSVAPHPTVLHFANAQTMMTFHIAIGLSRVGWILRENDYELKRKNDFEGFLLSNPYPNTKSLEETKETQVSFGIGNDCPRIYESRNNHDNLLPIWSFTHKIFKSKTELSTSSHHLSYFIDLSGHGSVRQLTWNNFFKPNNIVVGLLAIVTNTGSCKVLIVPNEHMVKSLAPSSTSGNSRGTNNTSSDFSNHEYLQIPVIDSEVITVANIFINEYCYVTSICWSPHQVNQLCCGMSDGSIAVYDLSEAIETGKSASVVWSNYCLLILSDRCSATVIVSIS